MGRWRSLIVPIRTPPRNGEMQFFSNTIYTSNYDKATIVKLKTNDNIMFSRSCQYCEIALSYIEVKFIANAYQINPFTLWLDTYSYMTSRFQSLAQYLQFFRNSSVMLVQIQPIPTEIPSQMFNNKTSKFAMNL